MEHNFSVPIGRRIADIRLAHNFTQEELADRLGVSPKHISSVECGKSSLSLKNLITFCDIFHCSLDYVVLGRKEDQFLSKLPTEVVNILCADDEKEISLLNRYLQLYVEMKQEQE